MTQAIKVLVVDDHPVVREGLSAMLSRLSSLAVLGEAADGQQALDLVRQLKPDVVLMDLRLPVLDGVAATERIVRDFPATRVLILTTFDQDELILAGLRAGARGYLLKDAPREEIAAGIARVHRGEMVLHPAVAARMVDFATGAAPQPAGPAVVSEEGPLSERERDVLRCLADGLANKEIGARLQIAESTVKTHLNHLFAKLGVNDRTEAVTVAIRRGWLRLR
jgi:DNA-binding NarL/FixJ family response regulator